MTTSGEGAVFRKEVEEMVDELMSEGWRGAVARRVTRAWLGELCRRGREAVLSEPPLVELVAPMTVGGDTHGQFSDLRLLFNRCGCPPKTRWLFLGDYVDRGPHQIEILILLFGLKLLYPTSIWVLRGNHEAAYVNRNYGFYEEVKRRFDEGLYREFNAVFDCLPVCALVEGRIMAMHGGVSKDLKSWDQILRLRRPAEVPDAGPVCDLLWADPDSLTCGYEPSVRGVSYRFGPDALTGFNSRMGIHLVARAHQVMEDGYEFFAQKQLVTIFSAPNYCGEYQNAAAVMRVNSKLQCSLEVFRIFAAPRIVPVPAASPKSPADTKPTSHSFFLANRLAAPGPVLRSFPNNPPPTNPPPTNPPPTNPPPTNPPPTIPPPTNPPPTNPPSNPPQPPKP